MTPWSELLAVEWMTMALISSGRRRLLKLGDPTQRIDGFGGAPVAGCGVVRGVVVVVEMTGVDVDVGVVEVVTGGGGGGGVVVTGVVVGVAVPEVVGTALPTGGITKTCPTQIRLGFEILLAR